uniref:Putative secreted protein n=1 Tax=Anopheles triannulatus TaxID=58253 RepID=A0A2M4B3Y1_9DIPT
MYFSVIWSDFSCLIAAECCCCCCCCCCCWLSAFSTLSAIEGGFLTVGASNSKFISLKYFLQFSSVGSSFCLSSLPAIASRTAADGEDPLPNPELPNSVDVLPERSNPLLDASRAPEDPAPPAPAPVIVPTGVKIPGNVGVGCTGLTSTSSPRDDSSLAPAPVAAAEAVPPPCPGALTKLKLGDLRRTSNVESNRSGVVVVAALEVTATVAPPPPITAEAAVDICTTPAAIGTTVAFGC